MSSGDGGSDECLAAAAAVDPDAETEDPYQFVADADVEHDRSMVAVERDAMDSALSGSDHRGTVAGLGAEKQPCDGARMEKVPDQSGARTDKLPDLRGARMIPAWRGKHSLRALAQWLDAEKEDVDTDGGHGHDGNGDDPQALMEHVVDDPETEYELARSRLCSRFEPFVDEK